MHHARSMSFLNLTMVVTVLYRISLLEPSRTMHNILFDLPTVPHKYQFSSNRSDINK